MKTIALAALMTFSATGVFAQDTDLVLPGERWLAEFNKFVCADGNTESAEAPASLKPFNVKFGRLTTDYRLDNVLIKATFEENGVECRYSALTLADNAKKTITLVESKAFSQNGVADCVDGKSAIDSAIKFTDYAYLHGRAAVLVKSENAEQACGVGATAIGLHFQAKGRISK